MLLVDFIMHEYLHKYLENIKKLEKNFSIRNTRPLSNASPPPRPGGTGGSSPALGVYTVWN